jgi:threonine aldolase
MVALTQMVDRLADDHARARQLALGLAEIPGLVLDPALVQTNMVFFELADAVTLPAGEIVQRLRTLANVWVDTAGPRRFRVVTHYWIDDKAVELFLETLRTVLRNG